MINQHTSFCQNVDTNKHKKGLSDQSFPALLFENSEKTFQQYVHRPIKIKIARIVPK